MGKAEEAALAAANAVLEEDSVEAEETPSEPTEEPVAEEVQQEAELPTEVPEDIREIWETPDFEEEAEVEIAAEAPEEEYAEYQEDDETVALRKQLKAAEKKIAWQEDQKLRESAPRWKKEALQYTPYCEPFIEEIASKATSRRGLLREAKQVHDKVEAWAQAKYAAPDAEKEAALRVELEAKIRQEYQDSGWGKITAGPGEVPADAAKQRSELEAALARKAPLDEIIKIRAGLGELNV